MPELLTRACGCGVEFRGRGDGYDDHRRELLTSRYCPDCAKLRDHQNAARAVAEAVAAGKPIKSGRETLAVPDGAHYSIERTPAGWRGALDASGTAVSAEAADIWGLVARLTRRWLRARGVRLVDSR